MTNLDQEEKQINEIFDGIADKYPVINLNQKDSIPQLFLVQTPGNDNLVFRLVSGKSVEENVKKLTVSDKVMHVYVMSLSASGNEVKLKGGLGDDPLGAISTIFDTVMETAKRLKIQAILFRFTNNQMKGKGPVVQRILSRLITSRSGRYTAVEEIQTMGKKYSYVLAKAKVIPTDEIVGLAEPNANEFKVTTTSVGKTYIDDKTGKQVSKDYVIAKAVSDEAEKTSPQTILRKTKVSRRTLLNAQFRDHKWYGKASEDFNAMLDTPPVYDAKDEEPTKLNLDLNVTSYVYVDNDKLRSSLTSLFSEESNTVNDIRDYSETIIYNESNGKSAYSLNVLYRNLTNGAKTTGQMLLATNTFLDIVDLRNQITSNKLQTQDAIKQAFAMTNSIMNEDIKNLARNSIIKMFCSDIATDIQMTIASYVPKQYTPAEVTAITAYTGQAYQHINNAFLSGSYDRSGKEIRNIIDNLDSAFKKGERLKKGTLLYRGQTISTSVLNAAIDNKVFYFSNFVSTSLKAIIYSGEYGLFTQDYIDNNENQTDVRAEDGISKSYIGWVISNADRIKVIIPGELSQHYHEAEVILPRGTALKFNAFAGDIEGNKFVIEAEVIEPSLLESVDLYDGDLLMNEGKVEKLGFRAIKDNYSVAINEATIQYDNDVILKELVNYVDIESLSDKFK